MQEISNRWHELTNWLALQLDYIQAHKDETGRGLMASLWDMSVWLNSGYKGLTVALVLLVIIVNRILKRRE